MEGYMDIRRFLDRFFDTSCYTDEQLKRLFEEEKAREKISYFKLNKTTLVSKLSN
jgi:hypothetical protein